MSCNMVVQDVLSEGSCTVEIMLRQVTLLPFQWCPRGLHECRILGLYRLNPTSNDTAIRMLLQSILRGINALKAVDALLPAMGMHFDVRLDAIPSFDFASTGDTPATM